MKIAYICSCLFVLCKNISNFASMKQNIQQRPISPLGETSIRIVVRTYDPEMEESEMMSHLPVYHQHDGYQLVYMIGGQTSFMVDDEVFRLNKGDLFYISRNLPHAIVSIDDKPEAIVVQFKDDILPSEIENLPEYTFVNILYKKGVGGLAFRNISYDCFEGLVHAAGIGKVTSLLHTLDYLGRNITSAERLSKRIRQEDSTSVSARAHQYLLEHYKDDVKLTHIADFCHQQEAALCRTYKRETGMTLFQHLQYIRIESACTMLRNTTLSIAEVAYSCGFNTPSTFNRLFQEKMGMTPGEYRKL